MMRAESPFCSSHLIAIATTTVSAILADGVFLLMPPRLQLRLLPQLFSNCHAVCKRQCRSRLGYYRNIFEEPEVRLVVCLGDTLRLYSWATGEVMVWVLMLLNSKNVSSSACCSLQGQPTCLSRALPCFVEFNLSLCGISSADASSSQVLYSTSASIFFLVLVLVGSPIATLYAALIIALILTVSVLVSFWNVCHSADHKVLYRAQGLFLPEALPFFRDSMFRVYLAFNLGNSDFSRVHRVPAFMEKHSTFSTAIYLAFNQSSLWRPLTLCCPRILLDLARVPPPALGQASASLC